MLVAEEGHKLLVAFNVDRVVDFHRSSHLRRILDVIVTLLGSKAYGFSPF